MSDSYKKQAESLLDLLQGEGSPDAVLSEPLTEEEQDIWRSLQDIDEAAHRLYAPSPDVDAAWTALHRQRARRDKVRWLKVASWIAAAAVLVMAIMIVLPHAEESLAPALSHGTPTPKAVPAAGYSVQTSRPSLPRVLAQTKNITVKVPAHATQTVVLPDGTEVCLNAKSTLIYPEQFAGNTRSVQLEGEAYFKVAHDEAHPFDVYAGHTVTRVLGTEFNVRNYDAKDIHVTLVKGSVEVSVADDCVRMQPNQDVSLRGDKLNVANVNPKDFTSWREGMMYFDHATLRTIIQQIGAWYDLNVVCADESMLDKHFHYMYSTEGDAQEAIRLLNESSDLAIRINNHTIIVE